MKPLADEQAIYHIRIQGRLGGEWSARLEGMAMAVSDVRGVGAVTDLTGPIADQAALMGILDQLYSQGATLLAVERRQANTEERRWKEGATG